jgi:PIN like domain
MSSAERPEYFLDRSLGKTTAARLRDAGYVVHLIAGHCADDASDIPDEDWIAEGCSKGWVLLTKDKRIRYRAAELEALQEGHLFCLASGNMDLAQMTQAFLDACRRSSARRETSRSGSGTSTAMARSSECGREPGCPPSLSCPVRSRPNPVVEARSTRSARRRTRRNPRSRIGKQVGCTPLSSAASRPDRGERAVPGCR